MSQPTDLRPRAGTGIGIGIGIGTGHGKAILLGEHAVVYGAPALVLPIPQLTVTATATRLPQGPDRISFALAGPGSTGVTPLASEGLRQLVTQLRTLAGRTGPLGVDVIIESAVPPGRGLGSSAACARAAALALAQVLGHQLADDEVYDLIQASEQLAHGRASGIDAVATGAAAALLFRSGAVQHLPDAFAHHPDAAFVIADSGTRGSTREAVELLGHRFTREPATRDAFVNGVSDLTTAAVCDLTLGDLAGFGRRLTANHGLLREVGISTTRIDTMVEAAIGAGALGAKITGGGLGGCLIALAPSPGRVTAIDRSLHEAGAGQTWVVPVPGSASHDR